MTVVHKDTKGKKENGRASVNHQQVKEKSHVITLETHRTYKLSKSTVDQFIDLTNNLVSGRKETSNF